MINLFQGIGLTEILIIAVVLLVLFGGRKLPELGKGIGDAIKEFRTSFKSGQSDKKEDSDEN